MLRFNEWTEKIKQKQSDGLPELQAQLDNEYESFCGSMKQDLHDFATSSNLRTEKST